MPRAGLTPALVTLAAAELADEKGWQQLTLAAVAERLGVRQPSLYKHVASLAALRRAVSLLAVTELGERLTIAVAGRSGDDAIAHLAAAYREYAHRHPGRYAAGSVAPAADDDAHVAASEEILRTLAAVLGRFDEPEADLAGGAGSDEPDVRQPGPSILHEIRALRATLHGFVALEAAGGFALALDLDESFRRMVAGLTAGLRAMATGADREPASAVSDRRSSR